MSLCVSQLLEFGEGGRFWGGGVTVCDGVARFSFVYEYISQEDSINQPPPTLGQKRRLV
jgi:hypothetical protein